MFKIEINNEYIDIGKVTIPFNFNNPMFEELGSYSYPFTIPSTLKNKKIFGFPNRLENADTIIKNYSCRVYFNGVIFIDGILEVKESRTENYTGNIKPGTGDFYNTIKDVELTDLEYEGERTIGANYTAATQHLEDTTGKTYKDSDYVCFPVLNENFYDGSSWDAVYRATYNYINYWWDPGTVVGPGFTALSQETYVPFPYLAYVLSQIFVENGFNLSENIFTLDNELSTLVIYNTFAVNKYYYIGGGWNLRADTVLSLNNHVPEVKIIDFLDSLMNLFCLSTFVSNKNKSVRILKNKDIINSTDYIDITSKANPNYEIAHDDIINGYLFEMQMDDNDDYISDVVKSIDDFNLKDSVASLGFLPAIGNDNLDIRLVEDRQQWYAWGYDPIWNNPGGWNFYCDNLLPYKSANYEFNINSIISTLLDDKVGFDKHAGSSYIAGPRWRVPMTLQVGNNPALKDFVDNPFSPRLLFYRGMKQDHSGDLYPLGSMYVKDYLGNIVGDYALQWDGDYGLFENFWEEYYYWYVNERKPVVKYVNFNENDLSDIDFSKKHRIDGIDYLIRKIQVSMTNDKISIAKCYMYKI